MNIERIENQSHSPPVINRKFEGMIYMPTEEERKVMSYSVRIAKIALGNHADSGGAVDPLYSYNHFITEMRSRGVPSEFANKALTEMHYSIGPEASLVSS